IPVFLRNTPDGFGSTKMMLLFQLAGCFVNSLLYGFLQPFPLYPNKALIFTGPFHAFGSTAASLMFVGWIANLSLLSCAAITFSFNYYVETMDHFKQKNAIFEFFRKLSVFRRLIFYSVFDAVVVIINSIVLYYSIDDNLPIANEMLAHLRDNYALIQLKSQYYTLEVRIPNLLNMYYQNTQILGGGVLIFFLIYCSILYFLRSNVRTEMEAVIGNILRYSVHEVQLRPSLAPRTFDILQQLFRLLILVDVTPIALFFFPTGIFIVINYVLPSLVSTQGLLIFFSLLTGILFSSYSYAYYIFRLIGFKYYRKALITIV
ncbi:hypothetical protein PMAYCL1PPCAC_16612, partial [Pristionchus mayeri]